MKLNTVRRCLLVIIRVQKRLPWVGDGGQTPADTTLRVLKNIRNMGNTRAPSAKVHNA